MNRLSFRARLLVRSVIFLLVFFPPCHLAMQWADTLPEVQRFTAQIIIIGTFILVCGYLSNRLLEKFGYNEKDQPLSESFKNKLFETIKKYYVGEHRYAEVEGKDLTWFARKFYSDTENYFKQNGFETLGNVEDILLTGSSKPRQLTRVCAEKNGNTSAFFWEFPPHKYLKFLQFFGVPGNPTCELLTAFSDSNYVVTSTAPIWFNDPLKIERIAMRPKASFQALLKTHRDAVGRYLANHIGVSVKPIQSMEACLETLRCIRGAIAERFATMNRDEIVKEVLDSSINPFLEGIRKRYPNATILRKF